MALRMTVLFVGRPGKMFETPIKHYTKLLRPRLSLNLISVKGVKDRDPRIVIERESKLLLGKIKYPGFVTALSSEGKVQSSEQFSRWIESLREKAVPAYFILGGAYGLSAELKKKTDAVLSLSTMTFPHELSLVMLLEQVYRSCAILENHPYHK